MGTALSLAGSIDGLIPLAAALSCLVIVALYALAVFLILLLFTPVLREALNVKGKDENGDYASTKTVLFYYIPGLGALVSGLNIPLQALLDLIKSIATLGALDWVRLIILFLLSALAGLWLAQHDLIILTANQVWTCDPVYSARHIFLEIVDVLRFIAGGVQPILNTIWGFAWSVPGVALRVTIDCTIAEGPIVLEQFSEDLAQAVNLFFTALGNYFAGKNGPLLTAGIDLVRRRVRS